MLPLTLNPQPSKIEVCVLWYISFDCPLCKGLPYDSASWKVRVWFQDSLAVQFAIATTLLETLYMMLAWMHLVEKKMECEPEVLIHVSPNCWQISPQCRVWKEKLGFMHFTDGGLKDFFVFLFLSSSAFFLWIPVWNFQPLMSIINHHLECPKHTSIRIIILHLTRLTTSLQSRQMSIQAQTTHSTHRMLQISIQNQVLELNPKPSTLQHYPSFTTR